MDIHAVLASSITDKVALEEFVEALKPLLESPYNAAALGQQARRYVEQECSWQAHLSGIDSCLGSLRAKPHQEVVA